MKKLLTLFTIIALLYGMKPSTAAAFQTINLDNSTTCLSNPGTTCSTTLGVTQNDLITCAAFDTASGQTLSATWNGATMVLDKSFSAAGQVDIAILSYTATTTGVGTLAVSVTGAGTTMGCNIGAFSGAKNAHAFSCSAGADSGGNVTSNTDIIDMSAHLNGMHLMHVYFSGGGGTAGAGTQQVTTTSSFWYFGSSPYSVNPRASNTLTATSALSHSDEMGCAYDAAPALDIWNMLPF